MNTTLCDCSGKMKETEVRIVDDEMFGQAVATACCRKKLSAYQVWENAAT